MSEESEMVKKIKERLANAPKFPVYCAICDKFMCNFTVTPPIIMVHYDCEMKMKKRQKLQ